jgi:hypothetical protein
MYVARNHHMQGHSQPVNIGVAEVYRKGEKLKRCLSLYSKHCSYKLNRNLSSSLVKVGVARAILCHTMATPLPYGFQTMIATSSPAAMHNVKGQVVHDGSTTKEVQ